MSRPAKRATSSVRVKPFRLGFLIHDVSRLRRMVVDKALKPLGVTRSQWWVLANLSRHEGSSMMQSELANLLDMSKVALGDLLERLEENGFVMREPDAQDRRVRRVRVSRAGEALLSTIQTCAEEVNRQMLRDYDEEQISLVEELLHGLKLRLLQMDEEQRSEHGLKVVR